MSDVAIAPAAPTNAPANQPAPAANEVPINQNPVAGSNPVGSQAPQAAYGRLRRLRRHRPFPEPAEKAIKAAFDRANSPPPKGSRVAEKPAPKPARGSRLLGHNNPPEETPKLDLRKRPEDQPGSQPRERGEGGRFMPRQSEGQSGSGTMPQQQPGQAGQPSQQGQPARKLPPGASYTEPPARFSEAGKRDLVPTPLTTSAPTSTGCRLTSSRPMNYYKGAAENF